MPVWKKSLLVPVLCVIAGVLCAVPASRELVIDFGNMLKPDLDRSKWSARLLSCGVLFLLCTPPCIALHTRRGKQLHTRSRAAFQRLAEQPAFLPAICAAAAAALILQSCISRDFWYDESFSLALVRHPMPDVIRFTASPENHPPLYYALLRLCNLAFPESVRAAKVLSAIPSILLVCAGAWFLKKEYSAAAACFFALLCMASVPLVQLSADIRMYSWAALFVMLAGLGLYYALKDGRLRFFAAYAVCAALAAYTHYFAAIAALAELILAAPLLLRSGRHVARKLCVAAALGTALYAPWVPCVLRQFRAVSDSFWIGPIRLYTVAGYGGTLFSCGSPVVAPALALLALWQFVRCARSVLSGRGNVQDGMRLAFALVPVLVMAFGIALSLCVRPLFISKYLVPSVPLMLLFLATALPALTLADGAFLLCVLMAGYTAFSVCSTERKNQAYYGKFSQVAAMKVTDDVQFIYPGDGVHLRGILSYLYPRNQHFCDSGARFAPVFQADWRPYGEADYSKPYCVVITENIAEKAGIPEFLAGRDYDSLTPSYANYKNVRFYWSAGDGAAGGAE